MRRTLSLFAIVILLVVLAGSLGCTKSHGLPPTQDLLTVISVTPSAGFAGIDTAVFVAGTGFKPGATVTFGDVPAIVTSNGHNLLRTIAPAHAAGLADVVVTNPNSERVTKAGGYTYQAVELTASPDVVTAGAPLIVSWLAPSGRPGWDWIGLFQANAPSTSYDEGWWQYTSAAATGSVTIDAPVQPGVYELRYLLDDGYVDVARRTVTVTPK